MKNIKVEKPVSNVIRFPLRHAEVDPPTAAVSRETIDAIKYEHNREVTDMVFESVMGMAISFGYFINPDKISQNDMKFIEESIFSAMCRYTNIEHPMHDLVDTMVMPDDDELLDPDEVQEEEE